LRSLCHIVLAAALLLSPSPHLRFDPNVLRTGAASCCWLRALDDLARRSNGFRSGSAASQPWLHGKPRSVKAISWLRARTTLVWSDALCRPVSFDPHRGRTSKDAAWQDVVVVYAIGAAIRCWRLPMADSGHHPRSQHRANLTQAAAGFGVVVIAFAVASYFSTTR